MRIVEVGPRDGLQNEAKALSVKDKVELIEKLAVAGLRQIEIGAFVSPKWVPQMGDAREVCEQVSRLQKQNKKLREVQFSVLVPNAHGMHDALKTSLKHVAVFGACSETFSKRNTNCTIEESFARIAEVIQLAKPKGVKVRGYLSTCFGCPYEGKVPLKKVVQLTERLLDMGVYEVSIGDTIGVATPKQINQFLKLVQKSTKLSKIAMHFHDTRGTALANVYASVEGGIKTFDSSIGSLGGCPYAKGASGNLATEDLVYMLTGMGIKTGVDLQQLVNIKLWIEKLVGRELPSHVGRSGLPSVAVF